MLGSVTRQKTCRPLAPSTTAASSCVVPWLVPARPAARLWIRRDDLDTGLDQVRPIANALRVPFANHEDDGRGVGCAVVREAALPILWQEVAPARDGIDVRRERERDDIGLEPIDDGASLRPRAAMRLVDPDALAALGAPARCERLIDGRIEAPRGIIGGVEKSA